MVAVAQTMDKRIISSLTVTYITYQDVIKTCNEVDINSVYFARSAPKYQSLSTHLSESARQPSMFVLNAKLVVLSVHLQTNGTDIRSS